MHTYNAHVLVIVTFHNMALGMNVPFQDRFSQVFKKQKRACGNISAKLYYVAACTFCDTLRE